MKTVPLSENETSSALFNARRTRPRDGREFLGGCEDVSGGTIFFIWLFVNVILLLSRHLGSCFAG